MQHVHRFLELGDIQHPEYCAAVPDANFLGADAHKKTNTIEIWGDGKQTRSFMYIDDCVKGTVALTRSNTVEPINIGSSELVTINGLVDIAESIAGVKLTRNYKLDAPKGVNGRNSDNTLIKRELGWEPGIRLREGMERTYAWIEGEWVKKNG